MKEISTDRAPAAIGPYGQAMAVGDMIYSSGQIPLKPDGTMVQGGIEEQVQQVLSNVDAVLTAAGVGRSDVVKTTIFMEDLADFAKLNEIYGEFFGNHRPARSTVQVAGLPKGARVEIEVIATKSQA